VVARDLFGVTGAVFAELAAWNVQSVSVETGDLAAVDRALAAGARLLYAETISNPRMRVADVPALAALAHRHGALLVVDNTFASPYHCRPLAHGADLVIESATKALAGHFDVVAGAVAGAAALVEPIRFQAARNGMSIAPFVAWLTARGAATLAVRARRAARNAARVATWLNGHPAVRAVHYPGLSSHPDHDVARRLLERGAGAMLAFEIAAADGAPHRFVSGLRGVPLVHSLGGPATVVSHPVTMSHRLVPPAVREAQGIHDGLFRLSVGIEDPDDIVTGLGLGLDAAVAPSRSHQQPQPGRV
jgi:cystathionine gamma-synthase/methionine-gamma-lyase